MKRFEFAERTDFVRGLVEESARVAMERHLASRSRKCRHTADLLQKAAVAARSDSKIQVPEYAVRFARAIFILQLPEKVRLLPRAPARLLYDCFREPLPAGVRTQQGLSRQVLWPTKRLRLYVPVRQAGEQIEMPLSRPAGRKTREGAATGKKTPFRRKEQ